MSEVTHNKSTLGTTAAVVGPPIRTSDINPLGSSGVDFSIQNLSTTGTIYIGSSSCSTTSYGVQLAPGSAWSVELRGGDTLYACASEEGTDYCVLMLPLESYSG